MAKLIHQTPYVVDDRRSHIRDVQQQLSTVGHIIAHVVWTLTHPDTPPAELDTDIGVSYRDRTRNYLPFTSVASLTLAYRTNRISKGIYTPLTNIVAVTDYRQTTVSQVLLQFNREVKALPLQDAKVMAMALAEILTRTLFFDLTHDLDRLDEISLSLYEQLIAFPGFPFSNTRINPQ